MDVLNIYKKINKEREKTEAAWVFSLWKKPELFNDYDNVNADFLFDKDAKFYFALGRHLFDKGYKSFDNLTLETFLKDFPDAKKKFDEYGGYTEVNQLMSIVNSDNADAYYNQLVKMNSLSTILKKYEEIFEDVERFDNATGEDVYNTFELLNNSVALSTTDKVENLVITNDFIDGLINGDEMGLSYNRYSPMLNYITLGASPGLFMIGGFSGTGKSSFVFEDMLMGFHYNGIKTAVISNEMSKDTYRVLLLDHILTQDLNYWGLTRKQIRLGKYTEEQQAMIDEATRLSKEKYSDIMFVRLYGNDINKICKYIKKLKALGVEAILYDTFKADDSAADSGAIWQTLLMDSRKLDNVCRKNNISMITTYQLALHEKNRRYLDETCLSNCKQVKEVYETILFFRPIWDDEFKGEKYDIHPWKLDRENKKVKVEIELERDKKYLLCFVNKTRADEGDQVLVYEWLAHFNHWKEVGFAKVINNHIM